MGTRIPGGNSDRQAWIDALILVGRPDEFDAARDAANGISAWWENDCGAPTPYLTGRLETEDGAALTVALAQGDRRVLAALAAGLNPCCLARCGVCAGPPGTAVPGDVIVAQSVVRHLRADGLPSHQRPDTRDAELWFMERLHRGDDPCRHPAFARYFPGGTWPSRLGGLVQDGLVVGAGAGWSLTETGRLHIAHIAANDVYGPATLPFRVLTGPAPAAAEVAAVAADLGVPHWLVAQGFADQAGEDRVRQFAARASAEALFALLARPLPPPPGPGCGATGKQPRRRPADSTTSGR